MIEKFESVVLNTIKYGESSKIAHLYTKNNGTLSVLAKGAFKPKSKFAGSLQPLMHVEAKVYFNKNRNIHTISDLEIVKNRSMIFKNNENLGLSLISCELIKLTQEEGQVNTDLFDSLVELLENINLNNNKYESQLNFIMRLIDLSGFGISKKINNGNYFSTKKGKFYLEGPMTHYLNDELVLKFKNLINGNSSDIEKAEYNKIFQLLINYLSYHMERRINLKSIYLLDLDYSTF
ncbi:DNA repair protein RecO [Candidatus Kapabacteria bacterium]|nr:DNA repair protein RecO [Candidatus Kapabacteria bacterium]